MDKKVLNMQSDRIEATLAQHQVWAKVTGGSVFPRFISFQLMPALGTRVGQIKNLKEELALCLNVEKVRIARHAGSLTVEIPRTNPQRVSLKTMYKQLTQAAVQFPEKHKWPFGAAVLGLAETGAPLLLNLPATNVTHALVVGTTGSGKTALMQTVIASLARKHTPAEFRFVLIDPKRRGFTSFAALPHLLTPNIIEGEKALEIMTELVNEMEARDHAGRRPHTGTRPGVPRIVVAIDEVTDLVMLTNGRAVEPLIRLAQRGREAGIHLLVGLQRPTAGIFGSLAQSNFPVRLVGQVVTAQEAATATGFGGSGAESLKGPGDFIGVSGGSLTRFMSAHISRTELTRWVDELRPLHPQVDTIWLTTPPAKTETPPPDDSGRKLAVYAAAVAPLWPLQTNETGKFVGVKADLAEAIFGNRTTAGHQGKWVERVIAYFEKNPPACAQALTEPILLPAVAVSTVEADVEATPIAEPSRREIPALLRPSQPIAEGTARFKMHRGRIAWQITEMTSENGLHLAWPRHWQSSSLESSLRTFCWFYSV